MDHDRPVPDTYSVLFDIKKAYQLNAYGILRHAMSTNPELYLNDGEGNTEEYQANLLARLNYAQEHSASHNINNIFHCQNSLTKLNSMLIEWCDIMLVENCVFLKFLNPSIKSLQSNVVNKKESSKEGSASDLSPDDKENKLDSVENSESIDLNKSSADSPINIETDIVN